MNNIAAIVTDRRLPISAIGRVKSRGFGFSIKVIIGFTAILLVGTSGGSFLASAQETPLFSARPEGRPWLDYRNRRAEHKFQLCGGYYALCAASTCRPTGKTIAVHVSGGGTAKFPEAECTCPIESGEAIADVVGGNMHGSCEPPAPGEIWSLYSPKKEIPQAITGWVPTGPAATAPMSTCNKQLNLGHQLVNCFSFACNQERYINGVPVATCYCPLGEGLNGSAVPPHTTFVTQAGQGDDAYCAERPVSGAIPTPY